MKMPLSPNNPFLLTRRLDHAYAWEHLSILARERGLLDVLDFGTFDGSLLSALDNSRLLNTGLGLDVNSEAIKLGSSQLSAHVSLRAISKGEAIPLEPESVDAVTLIGVLEHVYDQERLLRELYRVLRANGVLLVAVPGQHLFSVLDLGNLKFRFPRLHRYFYVWRHGVGAYDSRYVNTKSGLIGDIESEKRWHEHFSQTHLRNLIESQGFTVTDMDGMGFFYRAIHNIHWVSPVAKGAFEGLMKRDLKAFERAELFVACTKKVETFNSESSQTNRECRD